MRFVNSFEVKKSKNFRDKGECEKRRLKSEKKEKQYKGKYNIKEKYILTEKCREAASGDAERERESGERGGSMRAQAERVRGEVRGGRCKRGRENPGKAVKSGKDVAGKPERGREERARGGETGTGERRESMRRESMRREGVICASGTRSGQKRAGTREKRGKKTNFHFSEVDKYAKSWYNFYKRGKRGKGKADYEKNEQKTEGKNREKYSQKPYL